MTAEEPRWWYAYAEYAIRSGSRVICDPPPTDTDEDWLLFVNPQSLTAFEHRLVSEGFRLSGSMQPASQSKLENLKPLLEWPNPYDDDHKRLTFRSWKKDQLNLIVTCSLDYFENFNKATKLATYLNLLDKQDRITLFEAICYDKWPSTKRNRSPGPMTQPQYIIFPS